MEKLTDEKQKMEERLLHMEKEQHRQQEEFLEEATKKSSVSSCIYLLAEAIYVFAVMLYSIASLVYSESLVICHVMDGINLSAIISNPICRLL